MGLKKQGTMKKDKENTESKIWRAGKGWVAAVQGSWGEQGTKETTKETKKQTNWRAGEVSDWTKWDPAVETERTAMINKQGKQELKRQ